MRRDTVTNWIARLSDGDESAYDAMFSRYFERLIRLAARHMNGMDQVAYSCEDVALSAARSFCVAVRNKKLIVETEDELWGSLFRITTRKACAERRRRFAAKRGGGAAALRDDGSDEDDADLFFNVAGREPSPELALEMAESADELLAVFDQKPTQRRIVELKLQGASNEEIAEKTGLVPRTVLWHLKNIKEKWGFVKAYEYLIENLFAGFSTAYLARSLEASEETVVAVVEKSLALYEKEVGNPRLVDALRTKLLDPARFDEEWGGDAAQTLERAAPKVAERWKARSKTTWQNELRRVWNAGAETSEDDEK